MIMSTVKPLDPVQPRLVSDSLSTATSFPKYQKFPSQITIFGTSYKQPPLLSDRDHFQSLKFKVFFWF